MNTVARNALAVAAMAITTQAAAPGTERLYEANVTSVRAVVGTAGQRCWKVGSGTGREIATVGRAVAGAALGTNLGRGGGAQQAQTQNVQRCENVPDQARPDYWDVTYVR